MRFPRSGGTLVHPTSFPSKFGMGDFGPEAKRFVDFLDDTGQTIWQMLPLTPVGYGYSPYTGYSAFAGNPYLISLDILGEVGLLAPEEIRNAELPLSVTADFERSFPLKDELLRKASAQFFQNQDPVSERMFAEFRENNRYWLEDYALFRVCYDLNGNRPWYQWDDDLVRRKRPALAQVKKRNPEELRHQEWLQFEFFRQWMELREYANSKGIRVVGDIPIFVAHNSADVWAHPDFFDVDEQGNRIRVAGVPPDYFSESGQLWGNPLYRWDRLKKDGYSWWIERFRKMFELFDAIRVDHFRGFEAHWEVAATEKTARNGRWVKGPGAHFFTAIQNELGELPIIAEDLGVITPEVEQLRDRFRFPGMRVLQFAFDSDEGNSFLPHNFDPNTVVFSGTHDNDTSIGWYRTESEKKKHRLREYTRSDGSEPNWEMIRLGMLSVADQAIFPLQDYMSLGSEHRMNTPGTVGTNWLWRYTPEMLESADRNRIRYLLGLGNRF